MEQRPGGKSENSSKPTYTAPISAKDSIMSKRTRLSFSTSDRATKRVIAPYVRVVRRGQKIPKAEKEDEGVQFRFYLQKKPSVLLRNLSQFLSDSVELASILHETADVLRDVTKAVDVTAYMVDASAGELYNSPRNVTSNRHKVNWKIEEGKTVAAYVALHKEYVMVDDVLGDLRFPEGVGYQDETIKSVLCVPVVTPDDDCFAVIELCRDVTQPVFEKDDLKIVIVVTGWMGTAIYQNQQRLALQKQQELNDYLLNLTKCYFAETVLPEKLISEVISFAKLSIGAERGSFYVVEKEDERLVATAFEEALEDAEYKGIFRKKHKLDFSVDGGIPGYVARNREIVNIKDAYKDPRFNKEVDEKVSFITRSVLCMPVSGVNEILGVVQLMNKTSAFSFTPADENLLNTFSLYCSLALHYYRLNTLMEKTDKKNKSYLDILHYHIKPCQHDIENLYAVSEAEVVPDDFGQYSWYITPNLTSYMPQLAMYMIVDISGESYIEYDHLKECVLSVQKSYRENPYHCFEHAFNVCHCMYNIVKRNMHVFTPIECKALIVAALCHDLDHKGFTNNFLLLTNDPLVQLYEESYLENHHYLVTMVILNEYKMFKNMTEGEFREMSREIKSLILATDLALYFKCRTKLIQIWHEDLFDWYNLGHRDMVKSIMMTTCDLSGQCKPYNVAKKITDGLYREFYRQGDIEKSMGVCPLSMMDREKQHMIPDDQVQFLSVVVIPCAELLQTVLPNTDGLYLEAQRLRETWRHIIELTGQKTWRHGDSYVPSD